MTEHRYDPSELRGDYIRAGAGLAVCIGAVMVSGGGGAAAIIFGLAGLLFLVFGLRTLVRQGSIFELTPEGIKRSNARNFGPPANRLLWREITTVKLSFYSTRRDRSNGWMQLRLTGSEGKICLDSTVAGFEKIAERAAHAAAENSLRLGTATVSNFASVGISVRTEDGKAVAAARPGRRSYASGPQHKEL